MRRPLTSTAATQSANLRRCGLHTLPGEMLPRRPLTEPKMCANEIFGAESGEQGHRDYCSFTAVAEFSTSKQSLGDTPRSCRFFKTKGHLWCREGESNPQGTKYRRILSSTVGSEQLGKFSTLLDSSTAYKNADSFRHDPFCRVLSMELLQFYYSLVGRDCATTTGFGDHQVCSECL
jgi:hypothetical protein